MLTETENSINEFKSKWETATLRTSKLEYTYKENSQTDARQKEMKTANTTEALWASIHNSIALPILKVTIFEIQCLSYPCMSLYIYNKFIYIYTYMYMYLYMYAKQHRTLIVLLKTLHKKYCYNYLLV